MLWWPACRNQTRAEMANPGLILLKGSALARPRT